MKETDTPINITTKCNSDCIFCSRIGEVFGDPEEMIPGIIRSQKNTISFEGGEPTLCPELFKWIDLAKRGKTREIILVTNGILLCNIDYCRKLIKSGITLFNINLPAHVQELHDLLTGTKGTLKLKLQAIKNLISLGQGVKTRLTFVITAENYTILPDYMRFVKKNFPEIFYIALNFIKIAGRVKERKYLVPRLRDVAPYLEKALEYCQKNEIKILSDGLPLCYLKGYEDRAIDSYKIIHKNSTFLGEKNKSAGCARCSVNMLCSGVRKDYMRLYGDGDILPFSKQEQKGVSERILKKYSDVLLLPIIEKCNLNCLFCSAKGRSGKTDLTSIRSLLNQARKGLIISGGEPTLSEDLLEIIKEAKGRNLFVELQTNGVNLYYSDLARQLVQAGVDLFNINFPSHIGSVHDKLTQTDGTLPLKIAGLKNLTAFKANIRLTHIINGLNYKKLEEYVDFINNNFPKVKYIQFSFLKIIGAVRSHQEIIITYQQVSPYLLLALKKCKQNKIGFIVDHIPACYLGNYKKYHVDYLKANERQNSGDSFYSLMEKMKIEDCSQCSFCDFCCGVRKDYLDFFGKDAKVKPFNQ
jgi:MoaA/NifB/PqqE/SkfB family radical SAM enzyme